MALANVKKGSKCVSTYVGRKEDEMGSFIMTVEDIKTKLRSAKQGDWIDGGVLNCGDMRFILKVYPNGDVPIEVGSIVMEISAKNRGKRQWKGIELLIAGSSTGAFLKTHTQKIFPRVLKTDISKAHIVKVLFSVLSHDKALANENASFFPNGKLTVKVNVVIQGEETVTHTKLSNESSADSQLKGEISGHFRKMLKSHQFSDFRIICKGEIIPCHRNILAARSEIFEAMFEHNMTENQTGEVVINDFDLETVKALVLHIYTGEVEYNKEIAEQLIRAADKYQLHGLRKKVEEALISEVKIQNAIDMFVLGDAVHADKLRDVSKEVIVRNAVAIVKIDGWKEKLGRFQNLTLEIFQAVVNRRDNAK